MDATGKDGAYLMADFLVRSWSWKLVLAVIGKNNSLLGQIERQVWEAGQRTLSHYHELKLRITEQLCNCQSLFFTPHGIRIQDCSYLCPIYIAHITVIGYHWNTTPIITFVFCLTFRQVYFLFSSPFSSQQPYVIGQDEKWWVVQGHPTKLLGWVEIWI